ncbi:GDSL-type esterase/lipase family protein [Pontibacter anaerobius]|uniref:GDSL-type esterase/lipase family protein n=1 Tax=Pontibacter anaerobius TaxID=2993940 RepID=A0ABT3RDH3_9BACT|nr:GDSL-type esterase/lipase family protein [Pontibacter anaerobius]MCX2739476.1 GDSL-type esterase/lipase family protein [Pontibacter anaerobius]
MTLGNSITQGNQEYPGYKYRLWKKLVDAEVEVELVGSHDVNRDGPPSVKGEVYKGQTFTNRNEGHWGWRADEILNGRDDQRQAGRLKEWLRGYSPDLVLLHLGSNDVMQEQPVAETIEELEEIVREIRKTNPDVTVLLAQLIPMNYNNVGPNTINRLNEFNAQIPPLAERLNTLQSPVIVVDQFSDFDPTPGVDTWDGIHPNTSGEEKMAQRWFDAIMSEVITPLPVELTAFGARTNTQGQVLLEWQTASETNNAYFEVQRSQSGKDFQPIGQVKGSGTTVVAQNYTFTDSAAMSGTLYYRLKQVDTDGTSSFSKVAQVQVQEREQVLQVFPTSSRGQNITLHLQHHTSTDEAHVHIYTSEGKLVHSMENVQGINGAFRTRIFTEQLHGAGLYLVRVAAGNEVYQTEFVVEQ